MMATNPVSGIDMGDISIDRRGTPMDLKFNETQMQMLLEDPISGFIPMIIEIQPVANPYSFLGLAIGGLADWRIGALANSGFSHQSLHFNGNRTLFF